MVPQNIRLGRKSINLIQREGKRDETSFFIIYTSPSNSEAGRIGVVVSSKVSKKASERNRIRRVAISCLLEYQKTKSDDMLAVAKPSAHKTPGEKLREDIFKNLFI